MISRLNTFRVFLIRGLVVKKDFASNIVLKWFETFLVKNRMVYYGMESERIRGWEIEGGA